MPSYTYTVDKTNALKYDVRLLAEGDVLAGTVSVVWPEDKDQINGRVMVGPYSVSPNIRGQSLSYALLWIGLSMVEQAGYQKMKTGAVHGVLHDTMKGAGLRINESKIDPTMRSKLKSSHLAESKLDQNTMAIWECDDIATAIQACEGKMKGKGVTVTPPSISKGSKSGFCGGCTIM